MKRARWLGFLLIGIWVAGPLPAFAARPLLTEDSGTVDKGAFELELGFDYLRDHNRDQFYIPSAQLKYGPMEKMEVAATIGYIFNDVHEGELLDGWSDTFVYLKYQLWDEGETYPAFTMKPLIKFSTATWKKVQGSGETDYALGAVFSKSFSNLKLHFDAFYFWVGEKDKTDILSTGLAAEYDLQKGWTAVGEIRYLENFNADRKDDPIFVNLGLKKKYGPAVFDTAFHIGLNSAAQDYGFTVGLTLKFK